MKKIAILGITGSIGKSAVEVVREQKKHFKIQIATAHNNVKELLSLAAEFKIPHLVITNANAQKQNLEIPKASKLYFGESELQNLLQNEEYDIALNAISGSAGLIPSYNILKCEKDLALANKESLVMAGHILTKMQTKNKILPVDSEHSALFQVLHGEGKKNIRNLILTASGGSFRDTPLPALKNVSLKETLDHPNWDMGAKVTIDSATMFNKALEVTEAHWLFDINYEDIEVVLHPQSIIHSMVKFIDGSILAQMSQPSMKLPILYALSFPDRYSSHLVETDLSQLAELTFRKITKQRYPLFFHTVELCRHGGLLPTIINSINEAAITLFLQNKIQFLDISKLIINITDQFPNKAEPNLEEIINTNKEVFDFTIRNFTKFI
ncbi:MAG: 1-deoxy-D-xylulose-5-phosphate reductoisomerase [Candidatus Cloacimonadota bacterium]|jgi:1-deoxy-D-xylulose-5-phosphate reductoisomerase|nr:1-deoxy-D-xylulose-5-phosphate reductoisomerase [Candidatus Cloacimonadota bacterium]